MARCPYCRQVIKRPKPKPQPIYPYEEDQLRAWFSSMVQSSNKDRLTNAEVSTLYRNAVLKGQVVWANAQVVNRALASVGAVRYRTARERGWDLPPR